MSNRSVVVANVGAYLVLSALLLATPGEGAAQPYARLELVSGDRQIIVGSPPLPAVPLQPYRVRALDSAGNPVPGVTLLIGPSASFGGPLLLDEYRFRGFNTPFFGSYTNFGDPRPEYLATTNSNGIATASGPYWDQPSSASMVGAGIYPGTGFAPQAFFFVVMVKTAPPGNPSVVAEYFNANNGHYFNTLLEQEIKLLDAGSFAGWSRSIGSFIAYATEQDAPADFVPVCRFFSSKYTSHFYTADPSECDFVTEHWPETWLLESRTAFYIGVPDKASGTCAGGLQPIYRLYNNRSDPNHRYVTDRRLRDVMVTSGWVAEGYGPDAVMMCTPE